MLTEIIEALEAFQHFSPVTKWAAMRLYAIEKDIDLGQLAQIATLYEGGFE